MIFNMTLLGLLIRLVVLLIPPLLLEYGDALHLVSVGSQVLLGPHQPHSCKGLSSTLSIC